MRLWSIHPKYLDAKGLVAVWREGLLAQAVLSGKTKGYKRHPQLERFRASRDPVRQIGFYLKAIRREALVRGYRFDDKRITKMSGRSPAKIKVTRGQLAFEVGHILKKLKVREPKKYASLAQVCRFAAHPSFRVVPGNVERWER